MGSWDAEGLSILTNAPCEARSGWVRVTEGVPPRDSLCRGRATMTNVSQVPRRGRGPPDDAPLLPHMWLRKRWLTYALRNYPPYDPPHKVEERVLPKEKALENFEYFMSVRQARVAFFQKWLWRYFRTGVRANERGIRALNRWARRYSGLVFVGSRERQISYFTYDPPWYGVYAGCNVVFDIGITLGEFIIANCPKLRWAMDPTSALLPNTARESKRSFGTGYQRPELTGFDHPTWGKAPLASSYLFAVQMARITTFWGLVHVPWVWRKDQTRLLFSAYQITVKEYAAGNPAKLYGLGPPLDYVEGDDG